MKKPPAILPADHRAISIETLDRIDAASSKAIGLLAVLAVTATSEHWLNSEQMEGIQRLASDIGGELQSAVKGTDRPAPTPNQAPA